MSDPLSGLEPRSVWEHFYSITQIPRPSKHEERVSRWVQHVAEQHGFEVRKDDAGNLLIRVPATPGLESAPSVVIQGHLDMVPEKNKDSDHDFQNDPIRPRIDGEWVYATGTTLGADNGIGVAAGLACATDPEIAHGPLELLFTMDEETGLTGARNLDASMIESRTLLNLDSEEDGVIYVGCAGGADTHLVLTTSRRSPSDERKPYLLEITGLRGGHSGLNIHENRGNAVKTMTRVLLAAVDAGIEFELASLEGGDKHNAIPREAEALLYLDEQGGRAMDEVIRSALEGFRTELKGIDDGLAISFSEAAARDASVLESADRDRLLRLLATIPHGVQAMSNDIPGLVETSNNLAAVRQDGDRFRMLTSARSSLMSAMMAVIGSIKAAGELAGADVEVEVGYPGWKPNMDSAVLQVVREVYNRLWGRPADVTAIHAGLECGLIGERIPEMDMVSFGPQIEGAHSPEERLHVPSVERFWSALQEVLEKLAKTPRQG